MTCSRARNKFDARNDFYLKNIQEAKAQAKAMTMNIHRTVYFLLKNDLSMLMFEAIVSCKALIGNQLHSRLTARTIALMIDEMYQAELVKYLLSDKVDEFSVIGDELTDVGGMKTVLSKFRFFENE